MKSYEFSGELVPNLALSAQWWLKYSASFQVLRYRKRQNGLNEAVHSGNRESIERERPEMCLWIMRLRVSAKLKTHNSSIPLLIATFSTLQQMFLLYDYKSASGFRNQRIEATEIVLLMWQYKVSGVLTVGLPTVSAVVVVYVAVNRPRLKFNLFRISF